MDGRIECVDCDHCINHYNIDKMQSANVRDLISKFYKTGNIKESQVIREV